MKLSTLSSKISNFLPLFYEKAEEKSLESSDSSDFVVEVPVIQESTMQVPCGVHSIFDPNYYVPEFSRAVYLVINERSTWDTGVSHALSNREIADLLNVSDRSQVNRAIQWLIAEGWLQVAGQRRDGVYFYRVIHHKCSPEDVPLDRDGRAQKCAVPRGAGSATALLAAGVISWRAMVQWVVSKIHSCWTTGIVSQTVRDASKVLRLSLQTICDNAKQLAEVGLLKKLSAPFKPSVFQLFPKPYEKRRERAEYKGKKPLPLIGDWHYSYNKLWRFHKDTLRLMMKDIEGRWRDSDMAELLEVNPKIHADFSDYMAVRSSKGFEALRQLQKEIGFSEA